MENSRKATTELTETLEKMQSVVQLFSAVDAEMQLQVLRILMTVAEYPDGVTMPELTKLAQVSSSSLSRNVALLGQFGSTKKPALKWITATEDFRERRRKVVKMTAKGTRILEQVREILESDKWKAI